MSDWAELMEEGRRLASRRDDLIAAGADPAELLQPLTPGFAAYPVLPCSTCGGSRPFSEGRCLACGSEA